MSEVGRGGGAGHSLEKLITEGSSDGPAKYHSGCRYLDGLRFSSFLLINDTSRMLIKNEKKIKSYLGMFE